MSDDEKLDFVPSGSKAPFDEHQSDSDTENTAGEGDLDISTNNYSSNSVPPSSISTNPNITTRSRPIIRISNNISMAGRTRKQWDLSKNETISSFESWKGHLIYTLSLDQNFVPFLVSGKTWEKKGKHNPLRGLANEQEVVKLELLLGQIANFCSVISRNTILKNSTSLEHVWQHIRTHFGFQTSGSNFLNLCDIRLESDERPEDLFQRLQTFFEFNLLTATCGISHHGDRVQEDEEMSPTLENIVVFLWLQLLHKDLPGLVKMKYGTELRSKTLASIKPEISAALDSLLEELGSPPIPVLRTSASTFGNSQRNFQERSPSNYARKFSKPSTNPQQFSRNTNIPSQTRRQITCSICKTLGRPSNHFLSLCSFLTPEDKHFLSRARLVSALDDELGQLNLDDKKKGVLLLSSHSSTGSSFFISK